MKHIKFTKRHIRVPVLKGTDVLYEAMHVHRTKAKQALEYLVELIKLQNKNSPVLVSLYKEMTKAYEIAIDCAHKLAPYQDPKLESIEVKNKIEHRFVIRSPEQMATVEDWMAKTGASKAIETEYKVVKSSNTEENPKHREIEHYNREEDELNTQRLLN